MGHPVCIYVQCVDGLKTIMRLTWLGGFNSAFIGQVLFSSSVFDSIDDTVYDCISNITKHSITYVCV